MAGVGGGWGGASAHGGGAEQVPLTMEMKKWQVELYEGGHLGNKPQQGEACQN